MTRQTPTHYGEDCRACGYMSTIKIPDDGSIEFRDCPICGEPLEYRVKPKVVGFHAFGEPTRAWLRRLLRFQGPLRRKQYMVEYLSEEEFWTKASGTFDA